METFLYNWFFWFVASYLCGTVCFAYFLAKAKGINIFEVDSKSATSTNLSRQLGLRWGITNGVLDFLKAFIPVLLAKNYITEPWQLVLIAVAPTIGHIFPVWFNFKGGKGGATFIGGSLALVGWSFLYIFGIFLAIIAITKKTSTANLAHPIIFILWAYLAGWGSVAIWYGVVETALLWYGLRENIARIVSGQEPDLTKKL